MSSPEGCSDARGRPPEFAIIRTGGHGREMLDIVTAINSSTPTWTSVGFLDDVRRDPSLWPERAATWLGAAFGAGRHGRPLRLGIGDSTAQAEVDRLASGWGREPATLVHPRASVGSDVELGPGAGEELRPPRPIPQTSRLATTV